MNSLEIPHFPMLHTEEAVTSAISHSQKQHGKSSAASNSLFIQHGHLCVEKKGQKDGKKEKRSQVWWGSSLSISAGFLPGDYTDSQEAQQHFPVSPAVLTRHIGPVVGCGSLPAIRVRGDPIGSPSWQLFFKNRASVHNRNRQMLSTSEMRPLAFKSLYMDLVF